MAISTGKPSLSILKVFSVMLGGHHRKHTSTRKEGEHLHGRLARGSRRWRDVYSRIRTLGVVYLVVRARSGPSSDPSCEVAWSSSWSGTYGRRSARVKVVLPSPLSPTSMILKFRPVERHSLFNWSASRRESRERSDMKDSGGVCRVGDKSARKHSQPRRRERCLGELRFQDKSKCGYESLPRESKMVNSYLW